MDLLATRPRVNLTRLSLRSRLRERAAKNPCQRGCRSLSPGKLRESLVGGQRLRPLNPPEWIVRWQPQVALLSVAAGDAQGHPDAEVLQSLQGYLPLRTDWNGWIEPTTNGEQMWVEVERR